MPQERPLPNYLSHYPFKYIEYHDYDGIYAGDTDAQYLSLGISTWSQQDLSLKVWRKGGKNDVWLRQSEELPLHRPIDMILLLLAVLSDDTYMNSNTLEHQENPLLIQENPPIQHRVRSLEEYLSQKCGEETKGNLLKNRLIKLKNKLDELTEKKII